MGQVGLADEHAWRVREYGEIIVSFQWINVEPDVVGSSEEPAMFMFRRPMASEQVDAACVIPLCTAFQWANKDGSVALGHAIQRGAEYARAMGYTPDKANIHRIIDIVLTSLPDLVEMPPEPPYLRRMREEAERAEIRRLAGGRDIVIRSRINGELTDERVLN